MSRHRLWSLLVAATFILALVLPDGLARAQSATSTFTLHFGTCSWLSSTRDIVFAPTMGSADSAFDCVAGPWPAELVSFTLDGAPPDSTDGATSTWTNLSDGPHSLDTHPSAPIQLHHDVTVDGDTDLWATLYYAHTDTRPDLTPAPVTGATLTLNVWTCNVSGGLPSLTIAEHANESGVGRNCIEEAVGASTIRVDDVYGTVNGSSVTWTGLSGDVTIAASVAAVQGGQVTVDGDTTLVATFYVSDLTPEAGLPAGPGTVSIGIQECTVATGAPSIIAPWDENPSTMENCSAARVDAKEWGLRVDGRGPDAFQDNVAVWTNLTDGTHVATTTTGARYEFVAGDTTVNLIARFGPNGTAAFGGASATTQTPVAGAAVTALPKTGAGTASRDLPVSAAVISLSVMMTVVAGAFALRTQWIRRS